MRREWSWSRRSSRRGAAAEKEKQGSGVTAPAGCMSGMLSLFDLHQLLFTTRTGSVGGSIGAGIGGASFPVDRKASSADVPRGVEAPRNSLEMDVAAGAAAFSGPLLGDDDFEIPFGIQIAPRRNALEEEEEAAERRSSSRESSSARAGNVVAKLMGLDLPSGRTSSSPRTNWNNQHHESFLSPSPVRSHCNHHHQKRREHQHGERRCSSSGSQTPPPRQPLHPRNCNAIVTEVRSGTRSLPETPRISLARRSCDSDPRLSVQYYNKENLTPSAIRELKSISEDYASLSMSPSPPPPLSVAVRERSRKDLITSVVEESRSSTSSSSPGHYAKEIVRQLKDGVARRISGDSPVRKERRGRRSIEEKRSDASSATPPLCSPRGAVVLDSPRTRDPPAPPLPPECDHDRLAVFLPEQVPKPTSKPKSSRPPPLPPPAAAASRAACRQQKKAIGTPEKCKKAGFERFTERLKKPPPAPIAARKEALIAPPLAPPSSISQPQKSHKNLPLLSTTAIEVPHEKEMPPPPPPPPPPRSSPSAPVEESSQPLGYRSRPRGSGDEELHYVRCVLEKAGVSRTTSLPFAVRWHSPSHPLDPIIFHQLELSPSPTSQHTTSGPLRHRCNRKLLFHLADELLADILWPYLTPATLFLRTHPLQQHLPAASTDSNALLRQLWAQIASYPAANCQVRQDIDGLVELDLPSTNIRELLQHPAVAEEAEAIAAELERSLLDSLVDDFISAAVI